MESIDSDGRFGSLAAPLVNISLMSAFPESGHSDRQKLGEIRVRFRPEADLRLFLQDNYTASPARLRDSQVSCYQYLQLLTPLDELTTV
jgi:hypothetical protein